MTINASNRIKVVDINATDNPLSLDGQKFAVESDTWNILGHIYEEFAVDREQFNKALNELLDYIYKNAPKEDKL